MKKLLFATLAAALLLSGCASETDDAKALDRCVDLVGQEYPGSEADTSNLVAESFSDALFESGITKERNHSKTVYAVSGNVSLRDGDIEKRVTVICNITVENGEITEAGITSA